MNWLKTPKSYPYLIVVIASILMLVIIHSGKPTSVTFPLLLFMSAKLCIVFCAVEIALCYTGRYDDKEDIYRSISRAITSFSMAMSFILLVGAYELAKH